MSLQGKVVLITGASRGVGAAVAVACAKAGAKVALAAKTLLPHPRLPGTLGDTQRMVEEAGSEALIVPCDVRFEDQVQDMVDKTVEHFGRLDALVNNAGAIFWAPLADWPVKKYDLVNQVNVRASFLAARAAMPHLRVHGGHVLMMSPPIHPSASPGKAPYLISKIGMTMLAMAIDAEESKVAAHALWPVTGIQTAATVNHGFAKPTDMRKPEILADATVALLSQDPAECSFKAWLDEEVLADRGITDLDPYNIVPGSDPSPMSIQLVDPGWKR
jgi:citronellol/citronellal dehydrogenase